MAGVALVLAGIGTAGYQSFAWLQSGQWPSIDFQHLTNAPVRTEWLGLNQILFWFGRQSAALAGVVCGWVVILVGNDTGGFN